MSSLAELDLRRAYHKPQDDIAEAFYLPCMERARRYDRAVGFFSSTIYALAWTALKGFVDRNGKMRLICSPVLASADADAMADGYAARRESEEARHLREEFRRLLSTPGTVKPARVLAALVAIGVIDIRIAWVGIRAGSRPQRLFHDKLGLFGDSDGNAVAFKGSMNETWPGLALDGNLESVDVFTSWAGERERQRIAEEKDYFEALWEGRFPGVTTVPIPDVIRSELVEASDPNEWRELVDEICVEIAGMAAQSPDGAIGGRTPRPHQLAALAAWRDQGRRGILEHATGSGKTFTALCAIDDAILQGEPVLVVVPSDLLLKQWADELRETFAHLDVRLLTCGGGHTTWKQHGQLQRWTRKAGPSARVVLATLQTASTPEFIDGIQGGRHLFMVADEVHRVGALRARSLLQVETGPRLGLSATPRRAGDPAGTSAILAYFRGIVQPPFTLADAIRAGALTPYVYHVHTVALDADEQAAWDALTLDIQRLYARSTGAKEPDLDAEDRLKRLLIQRARIVKGAHGKVALATRIIMEHFQRGDRWIVYCDDSVQLGSVKESLRAAGCPEVLEYHTAMDGDPSRTLGLFEVHGGVMVSIRCLDEGVDIPSVTHALILASSKNPREYVQRRGRVLRRAPRKSLAHVHDVLVTPVLNDIDPPSISIVQGELARAIEFGRGALNPGCITDLERIAVQYGMNPADVVAAGLEDEDDQETT